jgi:cytoskeletal protein CcmA (bactofilin family)
MIGSRAVLAVVSVLGGCAACCVARAADTSISKVMGSIDIGAEQHSGDVSTVNGSIHIGENAVVGRANTVNGSISAERHATAATLVTVNGSIHLKEAVRVTGTVQAVNGAVTVADGADVGGTLGNVNGPIRVAAAHVGGLIDTATGDIEIGPNAHVDGGIHVEKDTGWFHIWFWSEDTPRVVIAPGSVVGGTLSFERKVNLYVSDRATIGRVAGATAVRFSGDRPSR